MGVLCGWIVGENRRESPSGTAVRKKRGWCGSKTTREGVPVGGCSVQFAGKTGGKAQHALCGSAIKAAVAAMPEVLNEFVTELVGANSDAAEETQSLCSCAMVRQPATPPSDASTGNACTACNRADAAAQCYNGLEYPNSK